MIEAVVQTGTFETRYRRAGSGASVLLLDPQGHQAPGAWLFDALTARFRVIAPVVPQAVAAGDEAAGALEPWLRGLVDGLGLDRPGVVASASLGPALRRFEARDPFRLGPIALVETDTAAPLMRRAAFDAIAERLVAGG